MKKCNICETPILSSRTFCNECAIARKRKFGREHAQRKRDINKKEELSISQEYLVRGDISTGSGTLSTGA